MVSEVFLGGWNLLPTRSNQTNNFVSDKCIQDWFENAMSVGEQPRFGPAAILPTTKTKTFESFQNISKFLELSSLMIYGHYV